MKRSRRFYFGFLAASLVLFTLGAALPAGSGVGWEAFSRFLVLCAAIGCAVGTWGTAVLIASVYKVTWPLIFSTGIILTGGIAFALIGHRAGL